MRRKTRLDHGASISPLQLAVREDISRVIRENRSNFTECGYVIPATLAKGLGRSWQYASGLLDASTTLYVDDLVDLADLVNKNNPMHTRFLVLTKRRLKEIYAENLRRRLIREGCTKIVAVKGGEERVELDRKLSCSRLGCSEGYLARLLNGSANPSIDVLVEHSQKLNWFDRARKFSLTIIFNSPLKADTEYVGHIALFSDSVQARQAA